MADRRGFLEGVVYCGERQRRFTQQSPIMPDVWIRYGMEPGIQQELLLVPNWHNSTADLAKAIRGRLQPEDEHLKALKLYRHGEGKSASVAFNQNVVVANLWFDELVRAVLPLSKWWRDHIARIKEDHPEDQLLESLQSGDFEKYVSECLARTTYERRKDDPEYEVVWFVRLAGLICLLGTNDVAEKMATARKKEQEEGEIALLNMLLKDHSNIASAAAKLLSTIAPVNADDTCPLYTVNLNRKTSSALHQSVGCIKADAARRVFEVKGEGIRWAVVDSGIDATHVAFRKRKRDGTLFEQAFSPKRIPKRGQPRGTQPKSDNNTRVIATYDFVHIRELLGCDPDDVDSLQDDFPALKDKKARKRLTNILKLMEDSVISWQGLEEFLKVEHNPPSTPDDSSGYRPGGEHGTHVAGILAADWRVSDSVPRKSDAEENNNAAEDGGEEENNEDFPLPRNSGDLTGVCPEIELYDLRVLDNQGNGNEFAIMSALQFIRYLNNRTDFVAVHGANLSFSIQHDVANYACGRTPVCVESELLVKNGVVVVAAAGNSGRARYLTPAGAHDDGFRAVSITDPGNTASVVTVGSTHRGEPHSYGVSYFSSRGPTGDGRSKPDLVAPGEKILSTVPGNSDAWLDGTSMAAPHVSGAAALIMARYPEFIGQPEQIKRILCESATDLGRERYYQGAGLLDILRAMQSI